MQIEYTVGAIRLSEVPRADELLPRDDCALALSIISGRPITAANLAQHTLHGAVPGVRMLGRGKPFYVWAEVLRWHTQRQETRGRKRRSTPELIAA